LSRPSKKNHPKTKPFLAIADQFQLGELLTERPHSKTIGLKDLIDNDLNEAMNCFCAVDREMLDSLVSKASLVDKLSLAIKEVLSDGGRIFLSGCGATGRLSLVIENIWRQVSNEPDRVIGFMAGGDLALIHSIEKFEDFPDYGARQLDELGFTEKDLLIASTEGGETPWVIGTALRAVELKGKSFFLFCNPAELLIDKLKRCQQVFKDERIVKLDFTASSQALTGSTRLQASSILTAAIGCALFHQDSGDQRLSYLKSLKKTHEEIDLTGLCDFIGLEASIYKRGESLYYAPSSNIAMSVLTDTTERSPTFSLSGFDNILDSDKKQSWCYLLFDQSVNSEAAWKELLLRKPRPLEWSDVADKAGLKRLYGFDFSAHVLNWRGPKEPNVFSITFNNGSILFKLGSLEKCISLSNGPGDLLTGHLILKMLLNMHSTLLMGMMDRFESNIMTYVRPSNNKLIDRTVRYAQHLLKEDNIEVPYEELIDDCFHLMESCSEAEPIVLRLVEKYKAKEVRRD
jgi:N-acetylmuramic acid 6-phosphate etherase